MPPRSIHQLFHHAPTLPLLHAHLQQTKADGRHLWDTDNQSFASGSKHSFAFDIQRINKKRSGSTMREIVNGFKYMQLEGTTKLSDPDVVYTFYEECQSSHVRVNP